jgi:hypothetical protein
VAAEPLPGIATANGVRMPQGEQLYGTPATGVAGVSEEEDKK